jgi:hypothetical protein
MKVMIIKDEFDIRPICLECFFRYKWASTWWWVVDINDEVLCSLCGCEATYKEKEENESCLTKKDELILLKRIKQSILDQALSFAQKVAPLYQSLGWYWHDTNKKPPTVEDIHKLIQDLTSNLMQAGYCPEGYSLRTGGIEVGYENNNLVIETFIRFTYEASAAIPVEIS